MADNAMTASPPDRIYARPFRDGSGFVYSQDRRANTDTAYVRADLFDEAVADAARLRRALATAREVIEEDRKAAYDSYTLDGRIETADEGERAHLQAYDDALAAIRAAMGGRGHE